MNARRGDIWLVDFDHPVGHHQEGRRPAVVVSADALNESRAGIVMVVPITTTHRGLPSHVEIDRERSGLDQPSYAKCEDVMSISEQRLIARIGDIDEEAMSLLARGLRFLLDL